MKIKSGYIVKKVMGSYMLVATDGEDTTMQTMNETGAFIFGCLSEGLSCDETAVKLTEEYEVDLERAKSDVGAFIEKLRASGILDE
ncbi:MAG: PqqD family protein [Clostridia bacterium]|nr:PqqD family protein [Clostridia bacterium]